MPLTATVKIVQDLPVRYLDNKPFKTKIEVTKIQGSLPSSLIKEIDQLLANVKNKDVQEKWKKVKENSEKDPSKETVESELSQAENSLYVFHFIRRFKHPTARGRLIYALTFWNPFELIDGVGQMHGFFLDPPFQIVVPKTKDQWVKDMMDESAAKGRPVTKRDVAFFRKTYKRFVDQRRWINVIFVPTWTVDGVLSIHSKVTGIQSVTSTLMKTRKDLAEIIPQFAVLRDVADSHSAVMEASEKEMHRLGDGLRTANQTIAETRRREIEKEVPIIIPPGSKEFPALVVPPQIEPKPTATERLGLEGISKEDILNAIPIVFGLFLVSGFAANPTALLGVGILGTILLISGIVLFVWRKRSSVSVPEPVKKKVEEAKATLQEHVRGP
jgi:hypothetical protein